MSFYWLLLIGFVALMVVKYRNYSKRNIPLPPGPPADPLIGHLRVIPPTGQDEFFYELGLKYGDVVHLSVMGQSMIILNSVQAATDLLDKRGANYSDRPDFPIFDLLGMGSTLGFLRYGSEWRKQRAMVQQYFSKEKTREYRPIQTREARILAQNLLTATTGEHVRLLVRFSTSVIIDINYGHQVESSDDAYLKIADECTQVGVESGPPGATPVDLFPFLRNFPSWFPGTYYATYARKASSKMRKLFEYPYEQVSKQLVKGIAKPSFLATMLEDLHNRRDKDKSDIQRIQAATAVVYLAGAETTSSMLSFFLLAMLIYPETQAKAQEEIERVVGSGRLPEFEDRENLPFLDCILQETLRWHQTVPAGVPHKSMEDDIYNGMFIPKGSIIVPNARGMTLDESVYKDPFKFDPTRFLPSPEGRGEPYPTGQFGFGRRICPGRHLADEGLWIAMATMLTTINIARPLGENGVEIVPKEVLATTGISVHPHPYSCHFKPRSADTFRALLGAIESSR